MVYQNRQVFGFTLCFTPEKGTMTMASPEQTAQDFDSAWQAVFAQYQPQMALITALLKLTSFGEHPVEIERLAATLGCPQDETVALAQQWGRVRVEVGSRVMNVGGCAVDLFWATLAASVSFRAESRCPTTGTAIRVDFSPEGVERVEPSSTVVAVLHPQAPVLQEMNDAEVADADVCSQQPFFASTEAATTWLAAHPGGRVLPVATFFAWFRQSLAVIAPAV